MTPDPHRAPVSADQRRARAAIVWSFFVPPVGALLGFLATRRIPRDNPARAEALGAMWNGLFGTVVLIVAIRWLPPLIRWALAVSRGELLF